MHAAEILSVLSAIGLFSMKGDVLGEYQALTFSVVMKW